MPSATDERVEVSVKKDTEAVGLILCGVSSMSWLNFVAYLIFPHSLTSDILPFSLIVGLVFYFLSLAILWKKKKWSFLSVLLLIVNGLSVALSIAFLIVLSLGGV